VRETPDEDTTDWRAVCGRTACPVRRAGRALALPDPYTIDIPDDVKDRCEKIFVGQAIEEMLARLLREALEQETMRRRAEAVDRLLARRAATKPASAEEVQAARLAGRP